MHELPIVINTTIALLAAFVGGLVARKLKLPPLVGYLLAGVAIGPFTPGFVGDLFTIQQLAEIGVIFLLFGVGLHFSLRDLWSVRKIAIPGALLQMAITSGVAILVSSLWGWSLTAGIIIGLAVSIASTVVLLRNLMDQGLLNSAEGRVVVGWLVLEDLATVLILVLLPSFAAESAEPIWQSVGLALVKAAAFSVLMLVVGTRFLPWFLMRMASLQSRELFIVGTVVITLGTAMGAASLFGVSLALGAFLAGVVVSESALSHQVEAEVLPFRETFAVLFFVSIGMLVNPLNLINHAGEVFSLVALIVLGKGLVTVLLGLVFGWPARTVLVVTVGLSQIGEFSFLLGQTGVELKVLSEEQYSLLLTGALISIILNPFLFRALGFLEKHLQKINFLWKILNRNEKTILQPPVPDTLREHVVVIGYGRVGRYMVEVLSYLKVPQLAVELDVGRANELSKLEIPVLFGDAADSDILKHAHLEQASAVVVALPDEAAATGVVATIRKLAPEVPVIVRAATQEGINRLYELGATEVIFPELEGSIEIMEQTLTSIGYKASQIQPYTEAVRHNHYLPDKPFQVEQPLYTKKAV
ncbi:MAG TPA: cation:proton antiporter [Chloroflexia bacterium]|nr:cation:proton antiporter [Chloroflexia bacterium]